MKLGILTFHSQLNYISPSRMRARRGDCAGCGVLQCWAPQKALKQMGHEVVVVDRWHYPDNRMLRQEFATPNPKVWVKLLIRGLLGCGDWGDPRPYLLEGAPEIRAIAFDADRIAALRAESMAWLKNAIISARWRER